ncbi:MAG TPA: redoxin domain-containing protein, partial [Pirellulales bacterium]
STTVHSPSVNPSPAAAEQPARASLVWLGLAIAVASIVVFFVQVFGAKRLITPWYLPIGGTLAGLLALAGAVQMRRWWAWLIAIVCVVLAGLEWAFLLFATVLPAYTGPVAVEGKLPEFHARLADGSIIERTYFERGRPTAVIFFQGHWCPFCMTQLTELEANHEAFERAGADVVVVSIEDVATASQTQRDFPHLAAVSDADRELSQGVDVINPGFAPDGSDCAAPTMLLLDGAGTVKWLHRPKRFIARPSAAELAERLGALKAPSP